MYSTVAPGGRKGVPPLACAGVHFLGFWRKLGSGKKPGFYCKGGVTVMDINY